MRTLFYIILFITPTVLVVVFRHQIQDYLTDQGLLGPRIDPEAPVEQSPPTPGPEGEADPSVTEAVEGEAPKVGPPSVEPTGESELEESEIDRLVAERYPFPKFQSLESVVGNWREVPQNAYPEVVTLKKPVELELKVNGKVSGKSTLRVGQQAYPVKLDGNVLTVSGAPGALTMQGSIGLDETDFKERVRRRYEDWKTRQEGRVHKLRKEEKQRLLAGSQAPAETPPAAETSGPGEKPEVNLDGIIPLMVESIRAGEVKEIQLDRIDYWKWIGYEEIGGTGYWTGVVGYTAKTMFGDINAEGKALMRDGRVEKWIYSGSEEEIR